MLYINGSTSTAHLNWHVSEPQLELFKKVNRVNDFVNVTSVQADGDELEFIKAHFTNIPMVANRLVIRWFGDSARFIAANL